VLITVLNPQPILAMLRDTAAMHGGSAYMLLPNDTRLGGNEGEAFLRYAELSAMQGEGQISDGEQIVSGVDSAVSAFRFVLTVPHDVLLEDVGHMGMVFIYFILCTLCLGIGSAYMLARHNFKPVQQLKQAAQVPEVAQDEFGAIGNKLVELRDTGHRMHTEIERLSGLENVQLFDALLSGNLGALEERQMSQLAEHFPGDMFIVALLEAQEDNALAIRCAAELAALIQQGGQCAARLGKDRPLVVCCFPAGASPNDAQFLVQQAAEQLSRGQDAPPAFSCYIGDAQNELPGVHLSYQSAVRAKEYAEFIAGNEPHVVLYDKTMYASNIWWQAYDIVDAERRFTNLMIEGNYSAGEQVLREILTYYNGHDGMSLYAMRCRMFGVMNMMLNILHEVGPDVGTAFYEETKPLEALLSARTMQELEDVMFQIVEQLIGRQEQKPAHLQAKLAQIEHYIATHYYDPGMGVRQVADRFGLSLPYLSREFKREKGLGVLQFINTCRIDKAKQIMDSEGSAMVAQIAARVGYNSSQTFIRIFKQYEGITPGQYRTPAAAHKEAMQA
jgi:AraC-like DNA-binding protein